MLAGNVHDIAVAGGVEKMPAKNPLTKLKIPIKGVNSIENKPAILEKIY